MTVILGLAALYLMVATLLWAFQERITFPAPRASLPDPRATMGAGEKIELRMADGARLVGWYLPADLPAAPRHPAPRSAALLWFYGNGETIGAIWPILREFRPPHAALLIVDYPGYGASGGRASEAGIYEAGELAYEALKARTDVDPRRIYVYGRSLGSAVATRLAAEHELAGLILDSPFTSARGMAARHYRIFPRFIVRLRLDNLAAIARVRCPLLVFHGTADRMMPLDMARQSSS